MRTRVGAMLGNPAVAVTLLLTLIGILITSGPIEEPDVFWHILMGRDILDEMRLTGDSGWTYGPADPNWVTTQTGAEVLMWWAYQTLGWSGIMLMRLVGELALITAVGWAAWSVTPKPWRRWAVPVLIAVVALSVPTTERPQIVTFALLPVIGVWMLQGVWSGRWVPAPLVLVVIAGWTWMHGASMLVALLIPCMIVGRWIVSRIAVPPPNLNEKVRWWRQGWAVALAAVLGTLASPIGIQVWERLLLINDAARGVINEWGPAGVGGAVFLAMFACIILLAWRHRWWTAGRFPWRGLLLDAVIVAPVVVYGMTSVRSVIVASLLLSPLVARRGSQVFHRWFPHPRHIGIPRVAVQVVSVACVAGSVAVAGTAVMNASISQTSQPSPAIISGIAASTGERFVLPEYAATGIILFHTQDNVRLGIDGRADRYGNQTLREVLRIQGGEVDLLTERWGKTTDVVTQDGSMLSAALQDAGWRLACVDTGRAWLTAPGLDGECGPNVYPPIRGQS